MAPYKRPGSPMYYLDLRWKEPWPRIALSTGTTTKARANSIEQMLLALKRAYRRDLIGLLVEARISLPELFADYEKGPDALQQLAMRAESPELGGLVDEWIEYLKSPAGVSHKTRRRMAPEGIRRYQVSWEAVFSALPEGRKAPLNSLSQGFLAAFRCTRKRARGGTGRVTTAAAPSPATLNRDVAALRSFLRWVTEAKKLPVPKLRFSTERESEGRTRWLTSDEVRNFLDICPREWQPLFATLIYTGARLGELQGLRGSDLETLPNGKRRVSVNERFERRKSRAAVRDVGVPPVLGAYLDEHLARFPTLPSGLLFAGVFQNDKAVRRMWYSVCDKAGIVGARVHDCRHAFAVHMVRAGVDLVRLQKLLGHASLQMVLRYAKYSDESLIDSDAERLEAALRRGVAETEKAAPKELPESA